jgi:outer membrane protein TolC
MKRIIYIMSLIAVFLAPLEAQDAAPVVLTMDEAVSYALEHSSQLQSAAIDLMIQERAADTAWNTFLPSASVTGTLSRANSSFQDTIDSAVASASSTASIELLEGFGLVPPGTADFMKPTMAATAKNQLGTANELDQWTAVLPGLGVSWAFNPAMIQAIKATHADYESGLISWQQTQAQVALNVKKMFYGILMAQESLAIQEASLESARQRAQQAWDSYKAGRSPEIQYLQAQVAYETAKPNVLRAQQTIDNNLELFAFLIGMPLNTPIELSGAIEPLYQELDEAALTGDNLNRRFDLQTIDAQRNTLEINKKALDWQSWFPSFQISWQYQNIFALSDKQWYADQVRNSSGGSLSFSLAWNLTNLLPWSSARQQAKTLEDNLAKLDVARDQAWSNAVTDVRQKINALELARSQIEAMQASMELAQKAYNQTETLYNNGLAELLDVRDAQNTLNQAKLGLLNEQYTYLSGLLDLEYALNTQF